ncbi:MAG: 3-isopropylmalate dehydrogenase, partial [Bacilli bacterium]
MNKILCLPGDGIGPELMDSALEVINYFNEVSQTKLECLIAPFGASAIDEYQTPFPDQTKELLDQVDAILLSAIGNPLYDSFPYRAEMALLDLRKALDLYANVRPIKAYPQTIHLTPFKKEVIEHCDIVFYRELSSGAYFGTPRHLNESDAIDTIYYNEFEITRIVVDAFEYALANNKKLTSVDKANVLATSKLWRSIVEKIALKYPSVALEHRYVDSCAWDLVVNPSQFEVIVTDNLFGDILSDQAASIAGSLGMLSSASFGPKISLYEPGHGSAPTLANKDLANPIAMIKSVALMYEYSF